MTGVERILERAVQLARQGQPDPTQCLIEAGKLELGDRPDDEAKAMLVAMSAAGGSLVKWYEQTHRRPADAVALLEEALFQLQLA